MKKTNIVNSAPMGIYQSDIGQMNFVSNSIVVIAAFDALTVASYELCGDTVRITVNGVTTFAFFDSCYDRIFYLGYEYCDDCGFFAA